MTTNWLVPIKYKTVLLVATCVMCSMCFAQLGTTDQAIEMVADSTGVDARTGLVSFTNIVIRQGPLSISANSAESSALGFDDSTWRFSGNVAIKSITATVLADELTLTFKKKQIDKAKVIGEPLKYQSTTLDNTLATAQEAQVTFFNNEITQVALQGSPIHLSRLKELDGKRTVAEAKSIDYDAQSHNLKLLGDAKLNEGANQISGNQILYNLKNQQVLASASDKGDGRVRITIQPTTNSTQNDTVSSEAPALLEETDQP